MCLVIDACCLAKVFDPTNRQHGEFVPVWEWISQGRGRMIYGGTKYVKEMNEVTKVLRLITELERRGRVWILPQKCVDILANEIRHKINDNRLNDEHLIAIVIESRCHVVCTDDREAMPFLKRTALFADYKMKRPRIYQRKMTHWHLCSDKYVINVLNWK